MAPPAGANDLVSSSFLRPVRKRLPHLHFSKTPGLLRNRFMPLSSDQGSELGLYLEDGSRDAASPTLQRTPKN